MSSKSLRALGLGTLLIAIVAGSPGQAEAQRTGTSSFILSLGGVDVLLAATATVGRTPLGPRLDPTGTNRITFTGLRPAGGADDGDCGFEEGTCDGEVKGVGPNCAGRQALLQAVRRRNHELPKRGGAGRCDRGTHPLVRTNGA